MSTKCGEQNGFHVRRWLRWWRTRVVGHLLLFCSRDPISRFTPKCCTQWSVIPYFANAWSAEAAPRDVGDYQGTCSWAGMKMPIILTSQPLCKGAATLVLSASWLLHPSLHLCASAMFCLCTAATQTRRHFCLVQNCAAGPLLGVLSFSSYFAVSFES